ncbi:MAG TPA: hypothetical protein VHA06_07255, partial [Candidatus Angelobacter sp.]|nr:hypothetical protein [Candidatus Angelobacter sp.]
MRKFVYVLFFCIAVAAIGQSTPTSTPTPSPTPPDVKAFDPGDEIGQLKKSCPFHSVIGCLQTL